VDSILSGVQHLNVGMILSGVRLLGVGSILVSVGAVDLRGVGQRTAHQANENQQLRRRGLNSLIKI
jgi:hypothetical protein